MWHCRLWPPESSAARALGLAGMANAATPSYNPEPRPGIVAVPQTKAEPAAEAHPGAWWHRHHPSLIDSVEWLGISWRRSRKRLRETALSSHN